MRLLLFLLPVVLAVACSGAEQDAKADRGDAGFRQWKLPDRLREISGLALTADQRLFGVADEDAVIYQLDYVAGRLVKSFGAGRPLLRGDFEGIAWLDGVFWLMTSDGVLYSAPEGSDGEQVDAERFDTGLGARCELEGLAETPPASLWLLCKDPRKGEALALYRWDVTARRVDEDATLTLPEKVLEKALDEKKIRPSGIARDGRSGHWIVVAAQQQAVFALGADGSFIDVIMRLDGDRHRQTEGIAITTDGRLLLADEGGHGKARLAVYDGTMGTDRH